MKDAFYRKSNILMTIFILIFSSVAIVFPLTLGILPITLGIIFFKNIEIDKFLFNLFIAVVLSGIGGPYLAMPGLSQLFLFRVLMWCHIGLFMLSKKEYVRIEKLKGFILLMSGWIFYSMISLIWARNVSLGISSIYFQFESVYILFFCAYHFIGFRQLNKLLFFVTLTYSGTLLIGMYEALTGWHLKYSSGNLLGYLDYRPTGMLVNTNDFAGYLVIYMSICSMYLLQKKTLISYIIMAFMVATVGFLIIETHSRTAFLSYSLICFLMMVKCIKPIFSFLVIYAGGLLVSMKYLYFSHLSEATQLVQTFSDKEASTNERAYIYEFVLSLIKSRWFMGVGAGNTPLYVFNALYGSTNVDLSTSNTMATHNFWLSVLSDIGFLGSVPIFSFFLLFLVYSLYLMFTNKAFNACVPLSIMIGFIGSSVGSSSIFEMRVIWIALGIGMSILFIEKKEDIIND